MEKLLSNKWVLIGGVAVVGLAAVLYMRGGSEASEDDGGATGFSVPFMYGGYAPTGAGLSGDGSTSGTDNATSLLLALEGKKVEYDREINLAQISSNEKIGLKGYDTQKEIEFRNAQSADFQSATNLLAGTIGKAKGKHIQGILGSGVGLKTNIGGIQSTISFGTGAGNPLKGS